MTATESQSPLGRPQRQAAIAFILLTIFIDILGIGIVIPVLPELVQNLIHGDESEASFYVGVIGATYALMQFLFSPILGALSDRFGRRPVLLVSLFGLGIDFLIQGFALNIWWLFIGRLLAGIMGASITTANAYIADVSTDENRARNYGFIGMMFGLGFTIGPLLGGLLRLIDLRLPFFVAAGLALINWLYGFFVLPESLPKESRSEFRLSSGNPFGTLRQLKVYPFVTALAIVFLCKSLAQRGLENVWVLYTGYRFGWDAAINGMALALVGITAIIVQGGMVRPFIQRFGERNAVMFGTLISAIAFAGYGLASEAWMMPCVIVFGALGGVAGPAVQSLIAETVDESDQGKVQGALTSLVSLTNVIAPLLFTAGLFKFFTSNLAPVILPGAPFLAGSALLVLSLGIASRVFYRFPRSTTEQAKRNEAEK
ncbi:TCR/Tet family MFS transporter [Novipirellula artificiosorum]|uniref:Tetracycline resistance protein, class C n=1 Tax=Novipirellula artificiosorum TaxID=2528016 RepID=A0A5C6E5Y5_9BACT|nr:TCR/Tet family MFS transporter [Novipirellula artificiosorum]TWU42896.1 Tetracycline resistance protein, class C [Novipirellula artificiosorum]